MIQIDNIEKKTNLRKQILSKLISVNNVISVSLVGSFIDKEGLSGISDIDTVVICNNLDKGTILTCIKMVKSIDLKKCGFKQNKIIVNTAFGPLKFHKAGHVVIHLMLYDINRHREHVIKSPFTCYDWERSPVNIGIPLNKIYPVGNLQLRDFMEARRSYLDYLQDIKSGTISYREYEFEGNNIFEQKRKKFLNDYGKGEFSYHIIKYLLVNYLKIKKNQNILYGTNDLYNEIKKNPNLKRSYIKKFESIKLIKENNQKNFPKKSFYWTKSFVEEFMLNVKEELDRSVKIFFVRHFETKLNDNTFLGQGRDPSIKENNANFKFKLKVSKAYSSPMRRCIETSKIIWGSNNTEPDCRLLEFNYGEVEGMSVDDLRKKFPEIIEQWNKGNDPRFPEGENTSDLLLRLRSFISDLSIEIEKKKLKSVGIVTHNGILRCLIGSKFNLPKTEWHKLIIPHNTKLGFLFYDGEFKPNISRKLLSQVFSNLGVVE